MFARRDHGGRSPIFLTFEAYVTGDYAKHFILALCEGFQEDLIVAVDGAPYFGALAVTDLAARDDLEFVQFPASSPEVNPVEGCWRQLKRKISNQFFGSLDELTTAIDDALEQLSMPDVRTYF
jgi:transposase